MKAILVILSVLFFPLHANEKKYTLSVCSLIENESKHLKEWIEYHRFIGIDHFFLYNISSSDRYQEVLKPYIQKNIVSLIQWPNMVDPNQSSNESLSLLIGKMPAYENAIHFFGANESKWLVILDVGEFLSIPFGSDVKKILNNYEDYSGVTLRTEYVDASVKSKYKRKTLVIESNEVIDPPSLPITRYVDKTIVKPEDVEGFTWPPHKFTFKKDAKTTVSVDKKLCLKSYVNRDIHQGGPYYAKETLTVQSDILSELDKKQLLKRYNLEEIDNQMSDFVPFIKKRMGH
jgi:hypothetical protein